MPRLAVPAEWDLAERVDQIPGCAGLGAIISQMGVKTSEQLGQMSDFRYQEMLAHIPQKRKGEPLDMKDRTRWGVGHISNLDVLRKQTRAEVLVRERKAQSDAAGSSSEPAMSTSYVTDRQTSAKVRAWSRDRSRGRQAWSRDRSGGRSAAQAGAEHDAEPSTEALKDAMQEAEAMLDSSLAAAEAAVAGLSLPLHVPCAQSLAHARHLLAKPGHRTAHAAEALGCTAHAVDRFRRFSSTTFPRKAIDAADRKCRDMLVWRCVHLLGPSNLHDRDAFIQELQHAAMAARDAAAAAVSSAVLDLSAVVLPYLQLFVSDNGQCEQFVAHALMAHEKEVFQRFSVAFSSKSKIRPNNRRSSKQRLRPEAEVENESEEVPAERGPPASSESAPLWGHDPCRPTYEPQNTHLGAIGDSRPGLCPGSATKATRVDDSMWTTSGWGSLGLPRWPVTAASASAAVRMAPVPECPARASGTDSSCLLVCSELNHLLVWRDILDQYPAPACGGDDAQDAAIALPTGKRMYIRPGACDLIAGLLNEELRCTLAIISCMGRWHCLSMMRLLLEQATPGSPWRMEEMLQGEWTKSGLTSFRIEADPYHGSGQDSRRQELIQPDGTERAGVMQEDGSCEWEGDGENQKCQVNLDGFLEWSSGETWWKKGVCVLYCARRHQRVYILDRHHAAVEEMCNPDDPGQNHGTWFQKDLDKVWNTLQECGAGAHGLWNTVLLDTSPIASHPAGNVLVVPRFKSFHEDSTIMDKLREYLLGGSPTVGAPGLVGSSPYCIPEHLQKHPPPPPLLASSSSSSGQVYLC